MVSMWDWGWNQKFREDKASRVCREKKEREDNYSYELSRKLHRISLKPLAKYWSLHA
jgi:hypothetical protein